MLVDLHLHTTCSDGVWSPERLFDEVRARELAAFCISDHDTLGAYPVPSDLRDRCISGLEVDSKHKGETVHILAYGIADETTPLMKALAKQRATRESRMHDMIARLCSTRNIEITIADIRAQAEGSNSLGRPHLARALVKKGYCTNVQDAFDRYIDERGPGYVDLERLSTETIIGLVHDSNGKAVIAHPARLRNSDHVNELRALGIDGIEVIHPSAGHDEQMQLRQYAKEHGLLITGGTDFHAPGPSPIGVELDEACVEALRQGFVHS